MLFVTNRFLRETLGQTGSPTRAAALAGLLFHTKSKILRNREDSEPLKGLLLNQLYSAIIPPILRLLKIYAILQGMEAKKKKLSDKEILARAIQKASTIYEFKASEEPRRPNMIILAVLGLIGIALIAYFAISGNYLASFLFFLAGATVAMSIFRRDKNPKPIKCKIKSEGIQVNNELFPYENLKSFWIFYDPPYHQELSIRSRKALTGYIRIPIGEEDPVKIRELLLKFIPEKRQEEAMVDSFARMAGL